MSVKIYDTVYLGAAKPSSGGSGSSNYNDLSNKPRINGVTLSGNKTSADLNILPQYLSVERLDAYIYKATFDSIPEYDPSVLAQVDGSCTSFVRDGKLYRNFDWKYDNTAEFLVVCKDFQGIASIPGMNDGSLDVKKVEQLPYHLVDGVNKDGIMVSTHILYNDWTYAGAGDKDQDIMLLPYYILNNLHDISNINTVLANYVANIKIPDVLATAEYLLQFVVTDGTTTYCIMPPASATGSYVIQDITSNPKLTNFRWVSDATVVRADLQTRPTGVERWNEVATSDLEDLRFTKCYESATRLSEFIGIDDTTKDSTDAELTVIYNEAHTAYQTRTRDGNLWQTVHSVVYGDGIEHLWCQEDFNKDYCVSGGVSSYNELSEKPQINGVELSGNKTSADLGIYGNKAIEIANMTTVAGYSVPNPTAEELTAVYNAVVAGNSVQVVDSNDVYYQVLQADSVDDAINVEILFFSEVSLLYTLENDTVSITYKKLGGGADKNVITLTGESGTLTSAQIAQVQDDTAVLEIVCDGEVFRLANKQSDLTYRTFISTDCALSEDVSFKAIYVQLNSGAANYGAWTLEEVSAGGGNVIDDSTTSLTTTWSSNKLNTMIGNVETLLANI